MNTRNLYIVCLLFITIVSCKSKAQTETEKIQFSSPSELYEVTKNDLPTLKGVVSDYEGIFSEEEKTILENVILEYEEKTTREIVVLSVASIDPYSDILEFGKDVGNRWGVGKKETDNGLIIILNTSNRKLGISTGLGTEKILTDEICQRIIDDIMIPHFKEDQYYEGVELAIRELIAKWQ